MDQHVVIPIDMLLDTRLATIAMVNPDIASRIVAEPKLLAAYSDRINDDFSAIGVDHTEYTKAYSERNVETLMASRPTRFFYELKNISEQIIAYMSDSPDRDGEVTYHINYYPYVDLTSEERELILDAICCNVPPIIKVVGACWSNADLSSAAVRDLEITSMYIYDFKGWLETTYGAMVNPETVVEIPRVTVNGPLPIEDATKFREMAAFRNPQNETCDPVFGIKVMFSPYFSYEPINYILCSIATLDEVEKITSAWEKQTAKYTS